MSAAAPNSTTAPSLDLAITTEAVGFLSAVGVFIAALALVFLFINKMLCFSKVGGAPCLEQPPSRKERSPGGRPGVRQGLVKSVDGGGDQSSSDSDNQLMKHFEMSVSRAHSLRAQPPSGRRERLDGLADGVQTDHSEDDLPPAVTEASGQGNLGDEPQGAPEGPPPPQQHSGDTWADSPAPSAGNPPITDGDAEDVEAGRRQTADGSAAWMPQDPGAPPSPSSAFPKCCDLLVSLEYRAAGQTLLVTVVSARDLPDRRRSGARAWQVHVVLLPAKKQRHKTSLRRPQAAAAGGGWPPLAFDQTFALTRVEASRLAAAALRFRMYALEGRMSRRRMMGEKLLPLAGVDRAGPSVDVRLVLAPRGNLKSMDSELSLAGAGAWSAHSLPRGDAGPELLLGLSYSAATGRMSVEIIKGSRLGNAAASRPPDTFARLTLLNSVGREISRCKTSVRRAQPNPVYKETFVFQVALFQLWDVTLMASVYGRRSLKRKEMIGWAALGHNSSGEEERLHWGDMKEARGTQVCRWHALLDA